MRGSTHLVPTSAVAIFSLRKSRANSVTGLGTPVRRKEWKQVSKVGLNFLLSGVGKAPVVASY
jgi:hypothetical protein